MNRLSLLKAIKRITKLIFHYQKILAEKKKEMWSPQYIVVHHTATSRDSTRYNTINYNHKQRWNRKTRSSLGEYCGYHYFIEGSGKLTQARKDTEIGAHTKGYNRGTIGIGLSGHFDQEKLSMGQLEALTALLDEKVALYRLDKSKIVGHKELKETSCPGKNMMEFLKNYKGRQNN